MSLGIDHLFSLVADRARAATTLQRWGFHLTQPGVHVGRGTSNHLAVFPGPYWELLAVDTRLPVNQHLQTLLASGGGLLGCALATADIESDSAKLRQRGIDVAPVQDVSRPVSIGDEQRVARFRVAQVQAPAPFAGSFFFCQHLTPELVWPTPSLVHANGALEIIGLTVVSPDPRATSQQLAHWFGSNAIGHSGCVVQAGALPLHCIGHEQFARDYPAVPWRFGTESRLAGITLRVRSISACAQSLGAAAMPVPGGAAELYTLDPSLGKMIVMWRGD